MPDSAPASPARAAFTLGAALTAGMALWLLFVTVAILPARDPGHVPLWRAVAAGFLGWAALSAWCLAHPPRRGVLRMLLVADALLACGLGLFAAIRTLAGPAAHFEGYLVLMGVLLAGHGAAGLAWARVAGSAR